VDHTCFHLTFPVHKYAASILHKTSSHFEDQNIEVFEDRDKFL